MERSVSFHRKRWNEETHEPISRLTLRNISFDALDKNRIAMHGLPHQLTLFCTGIPLSQGVFWDG
jgi:hypothetical protein